MSGERKIDPTSGHRWYVGSSAHLGFDRSYYPAWQTDGSYCLPLGEAVCLDAGGGFRISYKGADGRPLPSAEIIEQRFTPKLQLGLVGFVKKGVGLGVRGEAGYSIVQRGRDNDGAPFLGAHFFMRGNISEYWGLQGAVGLVREPPAFQSGGNEFQDGLGPEMSLGFYTNR